MPRIYYFALIISHHLRLLISLDSFQRLYYVLIHLEKKNRRYDHTENLCYRERCPHTIHTVHCFWQEICHRKYDKKLSRHRHYHTVHALSNSLEHSRTCNRKSCKYKRCAHDPHCRYTIDSLSSLASNILSICPGNICMIIRQNNIIEHLSTILKQFNSTLFLYYLQYTCIWIFNLINKYIAKRYKLPWNCIFLIVNHQKAKKLWQNQQRTYQNIKTACYHTPVYPLHDPHVALTQPHTNRSVPKFILQQPPSIQTILQFRSPYNSKSPPLEHQIQEGDL